MGLRDLLLLVDLESRMSLLLLLIFLSLLLLLSFLSLLICLSLERDLSFLLERLRDLLLDFFLSDLKWDR